MGKGGTGDAGFPLVLRMNHILEYSNVTWKKIFFLKRKKEKKKRPFFFFLKSTVSNKEATPHGSCLLSFKALWKSQDLGSEREAFVLCIPLNSFSVQLL